MSKKKVRSLIMYVFTILAVLLMGISTTLAVLKDVNEKEDNDIKFGKVAIAAHSEEVGGSSLELKLLNDTVTRNSEIINVTEDIFESNFYFNIGANSEDMFVRFKIFFTFGSEEADSGEEESQVLALLNVGNGVPVGMDLHHYVEGDTEKGLLDYEYVQHEGWYYVATTEEMTNATTERYLKAVTQEDGHYTISRKYVLTYPAENEPQILRVVKENNGIMLKVQVEAIQCEGLSENLGDIPFDSEVNNDVVISETVGLGSGYGVKIKSFISAINENEKAKEPELVKKSLADCTPAEIKQLGAIGIKNENNQWVVNGEVWFNIGDEKPIALTNGETLTLQIADFNHDKDEKGNVLPFTFITKEPLEAFCKFNTSRPFEGGWPNSEIYAYLNETVWGWIPTEWKDVITPAVKNSAINETEIISTTDYLFLLSAYEVDNSPTCVTNIHKNEGTIYPIFSDDSSRLKYKVGSENPSKWWLRSIFDNETVCCVISTGLTYTAFCSSLNNAVFAFCV